MKHELGAAACAGGVALMVVALCGNAAAAPPQLVPQGKIGSIILSRQDAGSIVGATLTDEQIFAKPATPVDLGDKSGCAVLLGPDANTFGNNFEAYKGATQKDSDGTHMVLTDVAIYSDTGTPARLMGDAFKSVSGCDTAVVYVKDANANWQFQPPTVTATSAKWSVAQIVDNQLNGWRCAKDLRVQSNVMLDAIVCQYGNPATVVSQIADRMVASISS